MCCNCCNCNHNHNYNARREAPPESEFDGSGALSPDPFMIPYAQRDADYYRRWEARNAGGREQQRKHNNRW